MFLVCPLSAAEPDADLVTLAEARELGRLKSTFANQSNMGVNAAQGVPSANLVHFKNAIGPSLRKSCVACHGPETSESGLRVDQLDPNLLTGADVENWREIYNVISNSEMPPADESDYALADADRARIVDWLGDEMNKASLVRRNQKEHSSFRRMTKYEYNYAMQDLLGLPYDFANTLPPETASEDGFKNSSDMLQMSAMQFETYRKIGLKALRRATVRGERPKPVTYIVAMQEEMEKGPPGESPKSFDKDDDDAEANKVRSRTHLLNREAGSGFKFSGGKSEPRPDASVGQTPPVSPVVVVLPRSNELKLDLDRFLPDEGNMRVSIRVGRTTMKPDEYASLQLIFSAHTSNNANFSQVISQRDVPVTALADDPQFIHFDIPLGDIQRNPFRKRKNPFPRRDEFLSIRNVSNAGDQDDPLSVMIDYIEISAPFHQQWPPMSHTNIFIESENNADEDIYGREVLNRFLRRVWCRPASSQEVDQFMGLFAEYRPGFSNFEDAMLEVLATALATPEFLYVTQGNSKGPDDDAMGDFGLASRLSFFLWSSIPDEELLKIAEQGKLNQPTILNAQIQRMLADPRAVRFSQNFVQQWLGLDGLESVTHITENSLKEAMQREPIAFFDEALKNNSSVMDFLHSDYAVVNERLAQHYGIEDVFGPDFRKVPIEAEMNRGGILTSAAVLAMNSDGKDSDPLKRGVWMLESILQDPPPPPPPNVPEVDLTDPEILKMTLKQRIADHRNKPACISCHAKIDPWGIAFENYDALGAYRTRINDQPVDSTSLLFNKQELAGMDGMKRYLFMDRQDQFSRAMVHKMTAYALGRPLSFGDRADIDSLTSKFRKRKDRLGDLIHLIVSSRIFNAR